MADVFVTRSNYPLLKENLVVNMVGLKDTLPTPHNKKIILKNPI